MSENDNVSFNKSLGMRHKSFGQPKRLEFVKSNVEGGEQYQQIYHFSIIDFLQEWDLSKKAEVLTKRLMGKDKMLMSAVPPAYYCTRFQYFMKCSVFVNEDDARRTSI